MKTFLQFPRFFILILSFAFMIGCTTKENLVVHSADACEEVRLFLQENRKKGHDDILEEYFIHKVPENDELKQALYNYLDKIKDFRTDQAKCDAEIDSTQKEFTTVVISNSKKSLKFRLQKQKGVFKIKNCIPLKKGDRIIGWV